jgi:class 3 adenylate cyclase
MDAAGSERAFIFGNSEGGNMACLFAATYPERTAGLVTWGTQARYVQAEDYPWGMTPEEFEIEIADLAKYGVTRAWMGEADPRAWPEESRWLDFMVRYYRAGASPSALVGLQRMLQTVDVRDVLPTIRVPTLVLHAVDDEVAPVDAARALASHVEGARLVTFPGRHMFWFDETVREAVGAEIEEFVTGTRSAPVRDRLLATVLFTDIVGSTEQLASVGDRVWRERVVSHHEVVRRALERFRGREIDTAGDGFFATFDGPGGARSRAQNRSSAGCGRSGSRSGPVCTPVSARPSARRLVELPCTSARASLPSLHRRRSSCHPRSKTSPPDQSSHSRMPANTSSKGVPNRWHLYRVRQAFEGKP